LGLHLLSMQKFLWLFSSCVLLLACFSGTAQSHMDGLILSESGKKLDMSLFFEENGVGFSICQKGTGTFSKAQFEHSKVGRTLTVKEKNAIVFSNQVEDPQPCLRTYKGDVRTEFGVEIFEGNYAGAYKDGSPCGKGTFTFHQEVKMVDVIAAARVAKGESDWWKRQVTKENKLSKDDTLVHHEYTIFNATDENMSLFISDFSKIDGDSLLVTVYEKEKTRFKYIALHTEPAEIKLNLNKGEPRKIKVKALNNGATPPNTAKVLLRDGKGVQKEFVSRLNPEESIYLFVRY